MGKKVKLEGSLEEVLKAAKYLEEKEQKRCPHRKRKNGKLTLKMIENGVFKCTECGKVIDIRGLSADPEAILKDFKVVENYIEYIKTFDENFSSEKNAVQLSELQEVIESVANRVQKNMDKVTGKKNKNKKKKKGNFYQEIKREINYGSDLGKGGKNLFMSR